MAIKTGLTAADACQGLPGNFESIILTQLCLDEFMFAMEYI